MRDFMPEGAEETDALGTWYTSVADPLPLAIAEEEAVEMMTDQGGTIPTDQFIRQCQRERELEFERLRLETEQHLREQWGLEQARRAEEQMQIEAYYSAPLTLVDAGTTAPAPRPSTSADSPSSGLRLHAARGRTPCPLPTPTPDARQACPGSSPTCAAAA